ncbi:MAG: glycosyltransferase family 2 protein [Chitinophagales bacterium]
MKKNSTQPLVSIITINYNQTQATYELLQSIKEISYSNFEVIVVDNASKENPKPLINALFPEVTVILSDKNLGFAGGNNLGVAAAKGDYLFFVNNDTELTKTVIEQLLAMFDKVPKLGMVSPKICYYDEPNRIQYVGFTRMNPYTARNTTIGEHELDEGQYSKPVPTPYAHGAAMMVKREVTEKVGLMAENFFLYYEELDWCERIRKGGYEIYVEPNALIYHKESLSVGKLSALKTYYITRNRILFMRRHASNLQWLAFVLFLAFVTIPKNLLSYTVNRDFKHIKAFVKGIVWNFHHQSGADFEAKLSLR